MYVLLYQGNVCIGEFIFVVKSHFYELSREKNIILELFLQE